MCWLPLLSRAGAGIRTLQLLSGRSVPCWTCIAIYVLKYFLNKMLLLFHPKHDGKLNWCLLYIKGANSRKNCILYFSSEELQWLIIPGDCLKKKWLPTLLRFWPAATVREFTLWNSSVVLIETLSRPCFSRTKTRTSRYPLWLTWPSPSQMCRTWTPFSSTCPTAQTSTRTRLR